jgi:putative ABC transport system permease protein
MNILTIPLRNIRRKPSKTILLLLVFSLGVMSIVALYQVSEVVGVSLEKKLTAYGANIVISPVTERLSLSYGGFNMGEMLFDLQELPEEKTVSAIRSIGHRDRISAVAPKLVTMTRINNTAVAVVGVHWQEEMGLKSYWAPDGSMPARPDELLLGNRAASRLGLLVGDKVEIFGRLFTVSGILLETGTDDDTVVFMALAQLQQLSGRPGATSFVEVAALCSGCPIGDIVDQLQARLPGTEIKALQNIINQRMASVRFVQKLALSISLVILVTAGAMVALSMMSAVNDRKKDIGILRSLGYGRKSIFFIFCLEAGFIGFLSGIAGYSIGFLASFEVLEFLSLADGAKPLFSMVHLFLAAGVFGLVTVLAALYPSWKGAGVEPSAAFAAI